MPHNKMQKIMPLGKRKIKEKQGYSVSPSFRNPYQPLAMLQWVVERSLDEAK